MKTIVQLIVAAVIFWIVEILVFLLMIYLFPGVSETVSDNKLATAVILGAFGSISFVFTIFLFYTKPLDDLMKMIEDY